MCYIENELKIMGINLMLISAALVVVSSLLALLGGDLLNLSCISFEVIFPFFSAIAVGEWGKTRADDNYEVIKAQGKSLFAWVLSRFLAVFITVSLFAVFNMVIVFLVRGEMPIWEMALTYFPPAFFLSTLGAWLNLCFSQEHISSLICGVMWLVTMLTRSLLRFPGIEYVYLLIRYAGDANGIWLLNKFVLLAAGFAMWIVIYCICRRKV